MPIYDYVCTACGERFAALVKVSEREHASCPACGAGVRRSYEGACAFGAAPVAAPCGEDRKRCPGCEAVPAGGAGFGCARHAR